MKIFHVGKQGKRLLIKICAREEIRGVQRERETKLRNKTKQIDHQCGPL